MPASLNAKTFANGSPTSLNLNGDRVHWEVKHDDLPGGLRWVVTTSKHGIIASMTVQW